MRNEMRARALTFTKARSALPLRDGIRPRRRNGLSSVPAERGPRSARQSEGKPWLAVGFSLCGRRWALCRARWLRADHGLSLRRLLRAVLRRRLLRRAVLRRGLLGGGYYGGYGGYGYRSGYYGGGGVYRGGYYGGGVYRGGVYRRAGYAGGGRLLRRRLSWRLSWRLSRRREFSRRRRIPALGRVEMRPTGEASAQN